MNYATTYMNKVLGASRVRWSLVQQSLAVAAPLGAAALLGAGLEAFGKRGF